MSSGFFQTIKVGQKYSRIWPKERALFALFPEPRVIAATRFGIQYMPPVSVMLATFTLLLQGDYALPQAIAMGLLALSFPVQGLYWLGARAQRHLPPQTLSWYQEIHRKMRENGCNIENADKKPTYMSLAQLLKAAYSQLDASFRKDWF